MENVRKHAHAQRVEVRFERNQMRIQLSVLDNGVGFNATATQETAGGAGLAEIRRRVLSVNGEIRVETAPGAGVAIRILFPEIDATVRHTVLNNKRILLANSNPLVIEGLRALLIEKGMKVVATELSYDAILASMKASEPDLVLVDMDVPGVNSIDGIQQIRRLRPEARVVILLESSRPQLPETFRTGADGYLLKSLNAQRFFDTLAQIMVGDLPLSSDVATQVLSEYKRQQTPVFQQELLTARQQEIFGMIAHGMTYDEIGTRLHVSERTVRYPVDQIRSRLGLANRQELLAYARKHGYTE